MKNTKWFTVLSDKLFGSIKVVFRRRCSSGTEHLLHRWLRSWRVLALVAALSVLTSCDGQDGLTVESISNDTYVVAVKEKETNVTTPVAIGIYYSKANKADSKERRIVRLVKWHTEPRVEWLHQNVLFVTTCVAPEGCSKLYFVINLDSPPTQEFEIWADEKWVDGEQLWFSGIHTYPVVLEVLREPSEEFHLYCHAGHRTFDLFILGAAAVHASATNNTEIRLDIEWHNGSRSRDVLLKLPTEAPWSIEAVFEGKA